MEIRNDAAGKPSVALGGEARELCERLGIGNMLISISHCRTHATALAVAVAAERGKRGMNRPVPAFRRRSHEDFLARGFPGGLLRAAGGLLGRRPFLAGRSLRATATGAIGQQLNRLLEGQVVRRCSLGERRVGGAVGHVRPVAAVEQLDGLPGHRRLGELTQRFLRGGRAGDRASWAAPTVRAPSPR